MVYRATVALDEDGPFQTITEALENFLSRIHKIVIDRGLSLQVLETTCWITNENAPMPLYFYSAKEFALKIGLLTNDPFCLHNDISEPPKIVTNALFASITDDGQAYEFIEKVLEDLLEQTS